MGRASTVLPARLFFRRFGSRGDGLPVGKSRGRTAAGGAHRFRPTCKAVKPSSHGSERMRRYRYHLNHIVYGAAGLRHLLNRLALPLILGPSTRSPPDLASGSRELRATFRGGNSWRRRVIAQSHTQAGFASLKPNRARNSLEPTRTWAGEACSPSCKSKRFPETMARSTPA
jgi:hypothetical protein